MTLRRQRVGIRPKGRGWQAYVRVRGVLQTKMFPAATSLEEMQAWRASQVGPGGRRRAGTFSADVALYLARKTTMPAYPGRVRLMTWWQERLGPQRPSSSISSQEVAEALEAYQLAGYGPGSTKLLRSALSNFFLTQFGKAAANPVRGVPAPRQPAPQIRAVPYPIIRALFALIPPSASKARLQLIPWTGIPPAQIKTIRPADIDWTAHELRVRGRRKGEGTYERTLPLCPEAISALQLFAEYAAWGPFNTPALSRFCRFWAQRLAPPQHITPYMLRHSFGTAVYRATGDLSSVGRLLGHSHGSPLTRVYVGAAVQDVDRAAMVKFAAATGAKVGPELPAPLPQFDKS